VRFEDFSVTPSEVSRRAGLASVSVQLLRQVEPICFDVLVDPVHDTVTGHPQVLRHLALVCALLDADVRPRIASALVHAILRHVKGSVVERLG
jgi:hypothetical protein